MCSALLMQRARRLRLWRLSDRWRRLSQVARLMAERTTQSWTSVPHFFLVGTWIAACLVAAQKNLSAAAQGTQSPARRLQIADWNPGTSAGEASANECELGGKGIRSNAEINVSVAMA